MRTVTVRSVALIFITGGTTVALQARANGELAVHLGNGVEAATYSFASGLLIICLVAVALRPARVGFGRVIQALRQRTLAWWAFPAGMLGGIFVACQSFAVGVIGVALFSVAVVAAQTVTSVVVDRCGLGPLGAVKVTPRRIMAAALAIGAVALAATPRLEAVQVSGWALGAAVLAGVLVAVQQALNGRISQAAGQPITAAVFNFAFGTTLLVILSVITLSFGARISAASPGPWWMWLGGALGTTFIVTAAWAVPRYGVLIFALISIAGQLTGALLLDLLIPMSGSTVSALLVAGALVTFAAVAVGTWPTATATRPSGQARP